jgi:hypothetical protein
VVTEPCPEQVIEDSIKIWEDIGRQFEKIGLMPNGTAEQGRFADRVRRTAPVLIGPAEIRSENCSKGFAERIAAPGDGKSRE